MASFDAASKKQVETNPQDFVDLCFRFGVANVTVLEVVTPEQPTVEMHQADILIKALGDDREVLVHFDVPNKLEYLGSLVVLGNLVYDSQTILDIISEETMQQPSIAEYVAPQAREQGIQQGAQEATRKHILEVLTLRLQFDAVQTFKPSLEAIEDLQRLEMLHRAAILAESPEDFTQALNENGE